MAQVASSAALVVPTTSLFTKADVSALLFPVSTPFPSGNVKSL